MMNIPPSVASDRHGHEMDGEKYGPIINEICGYFLGRAETASGYISKLNALVRDGHILSVKAGPAQLVKHPLAAAVVIAVGVDHQPQAPVIAQHENQGPIVSACICNTLPTIHGRSAT